MSAEPKTPEHSSEVSHDSLLAEFQRLADRTDRLNRYTSRFSAIFFASMVLCGFMNMFSSLSPPFLRSIAWMNICIHACVFLGNGAVSLLRRRRVKTLMTALRDDVRAIGPLAQFCHRLEHFSVVNQAVETLLALLPRMEAGDSRSLSDRRMQALLGMLDVSALDTFDPVRLRKSPFYRIFVSLTDRKAFDDNRVHKLPPALLKALGRAGDSRAIRTVKRMAISNFVSPFHKEAQECLALLEQQAEVRDRQRGLLLPSSPHRAQQNLLRPTAPRAETQPELLLRAANERDKV